MLLTLKDPLPYCLLDKAFPDSPCAKLPPSHCVTSLRQICRLAATWPGRELLRDSGWVWSLSTPHRAQTSQDLEGDGNTSGKPELHAAVHLPAGAPDGFYIWEQELPTGEKRMHLYGALERKTTDVGWQPALFHNQIR